MSAEGFPWGRVRDAQRFLFAVKPWWYRFMRQMEIVPIDIPPQPDGSYSGLTATDKSMNLYVDKTFALEAPLEKIAGALEKELQHHVRDSWRRMSNLPPDLREKYLNICMDLEVNSSMRSEVKQLIADGDKMTQWRLRKICEKSQTFTVNDFDKYAIKGPPDITDESWLPETLGLPDGLSAEKYYLLIRDEFDREQPQEDDSDNSQDEDDESPGDDLLDGHGSPDQPSDDSDDDPNSGDQPGDEPQDRPDNFDQDSGDDSDSSDADQDSDPDDSDEESLEDLFGEDSEEDSGDGDPEDRDQQQSDSGQEESGSDSDPDSDSEQQDGDEPDDPSQSDDGGNPSEDGSESDSESGEPSDDADPDQNGDRKDSGDPDAQQGDQQDSERDQTGGNPGEGSESAGQSQSSPGGADGDPSQENSDNSGDGPSSDPLDGDPRSREEIIDDLISESPSLEWWSKEIGPDDDKPSWMPEPAWDEAVGDDEAQAQAASERDDALSELADDIEEMSRSRSVVSGFGISPGGSVKDWSGMVIKRTGVDWRSRLSKLISASYLSAQIKGSSDLTYSVRNPNQSQLGPVLMGLQGYAPKVMVLQDVSGSMDRFMDRSLSSFKDIIAASVSNGAEPVTWITADTQVMEVGSTITLTSDDIRKMNRGFGGTVLSDIIVELSSGKFRWKGKRYPKPDLLIVSTDCMFGWPWRDSRIIPGGHTKIVVASVKDYDSISRFLPKWVNPASNFIYVE